MQPTSPSITRIHHAQEARMPGSENGLTSIQQIELRIEEPKVVSDLTHLTKGDGVEVNDHMSTIGIRIRENLKRMKLTGLFARLKEQFEGKNLIINRNTGLPEIRIRETRFSLKEDDITLGNDDDTTTTYTLVISGLIQTETGETEGPIVISLGELLDDEVYNTEERGHKTSIRIEE